MLHIQRETFFNYSRSLLPDWWINIPPASSYWQAPSLITKHTHNSVSICCRDNNGSGLLNSPHTAFLLLSVTLCLLPPSLHLEVCFFFPSSASMSLSAVFFFFPSSLDFKPWSFRQVEATERINVQHTRDQTLSRVWDSAHRSIWSNASRKIYINMRNNVRKHLSHLDERAQGFIKVLSVYLLRLQELHVEVTCRWKVELPSQVEPALKCQHVEFLPPVEGKQLIHNFSRLK